DTPHADVLAEPFDSGAQCADAAGNDVDLRALLRRLVELGDGVVGGEVVPLDADPGRAAFLGGLTGLADLLDQAVAQVEGGDQQLPEPRRAAEAGQEVEEVGDVCGDLRVGREETE